MKSVFGHDEKTFNRRYGGMDMGMNSGVNDHGFALLAVLMLVCVLSFSG